MTVLPVAEGNVKNFFQKLFLRFCVSEQNRVKQESGTARKAYILAMDKSVDTLETL